MMSSSDCLVVTTSAQNVIKVEVHVAVSQQRLCMSTPSAREHAKREIRDGKIRKK